MSLFSTVTISYQEPVVEEPQDYPQEPRLNGSNSDQFRIPRLSIYPTAGEKNPRGERLIKKSRARQARALERKAKRAEEKKKKKSTGRYCRLCDTWANSDASWKDHI